MPTVLSVTMAVGARLLAKKQAIVSKLVAIEELAGVDVLCADKTGTLTQNKLTLGDPFCLDKITADQVILARLIPLSQVRPYLVAARSRQHDFGPRFAVARAILSHSGCRLSATRRLSDCRVGLSRIGAAGDVPIAHRFMMRGKAEHSFERDVPVKAAIVAKDEFFEICVDVLAAKAMIGAQSPPLHQREDPMNRRQHDMAAILPTVRGSCR